MHDTSIFFDLVPDLMCITAHDGTFLEVNNAFEQLLGFSKEELIGSKAQDLIYPEDFLKIQPKVKMSLSLGQLPEYFESRCKCKDGNYIWLSWVVRICDNYFYGIARDISKEKKNQHRSEEKQKVLKAFVDHSPAVITMLDREMRVLAVSNKFLEEFKLAEEEVVGRTIYDLFPKSAVPRKHIHQEMLNGKRVEEMEIEIEDKFGKCNSYQINFQPWFEEDDVAIGGLIALMNNVSYRKEWESKLKKKKQLIDSMLMNLPIVIYRYNNQGIVEEVDGLALKRLGLTREFALGACIFDLFPDYHELKEVLQGESQYFTTKPSSRLVYYFQNYLYPDQVTGGAIGFSLDMTDQWRISNELSKAKEQAESASRAKTQFLASMSHEIRTPINAILGFADILSKKSLPENEKEYIGYIKSAGNTLIKIIGDILDLSKIEEGKLEVEEMPFNLKKDLVESLFPYKFRANENGLNFSVQLDEFLPLNVIGDLAKIRQVLINLISNSLKFTKEGGISVRFSNDEVFEKEGEVILKIEVADSGIGISENMHNEIFDPFVQAVRSVGREFGGSGLGLAIVQRIVKLVNGEIRVISPANYTGRGGPGTAFEIRLKLKVTEAKPLLNNVVPAEMVLRKGIKVLVAEDNIMNRKLIEALLDNLECNPDFSVNGEEVVEMSLTKKYEIILMDVQMPVMDGLEATRRIREIDPDIPIIGVTANVYKEDIDNCYQAGMNDFLGKPFTPGQLKEMLLKWTEVKK